MARTRKRSENTSATPSTIPASRRTSSTSADSQSPPRWTFLTNHSHVLVVLHANPEIVLRQVALEVGITERAVQRIIQDLEAGGFIERERVGRRNRYHVLVDRHLRHPIESHRRIGDLLELVCSLSDSE
jgi:DNA-binding transcriptional ArsR family regulator